MRVVFAACVVLCLSCARFTPEPRVAEDARIPDAFTLYEETEAMPDRWWATFNSSELDTLIAQALADNLTLEQIAARLRQAEMLARQAEAARWPELDATGDISTTRRQTTFDASVSTLDQANRQLGALNTALGSGASGGQGAASPTGEIRSAQTRLQAVETLLADAPSTRIASTTHSYRFGLASRYEVDLWGRVHARHQTALLDLEASREDMHAAMLSLTGTVARQWLAIAARRHELRVVQEQLSLNQRALELIEFRFQNGLATALDVYQQRQIVAQTRSLVPAIEEALQSAGFELAVLLGRPPRAAIPLTAESLPEVGPLPDPGLPADLIARRPDIRAAGLQLEAADWRVSAARADRLPALRLSASASYGAEEWSALFDNWMATLAGSITGPVFDAGRRKAEVERTRALVDERLAAYRYRVLEGVKEVESAMMREARQREYVALLEGERETARATYQQALQRYLNGVIDYLPVLTALTQLQAIERRLVQAEYSRLERRIQLYIALGGGWMEEGRYLENQQ